MHLTRSRPFALLLLLCLLFAQMAAGAHALTHLPAAHSAADVADAPDGDGKGASHVCLECLAGEGLDAAAPSTGHGVPVTFARGLPVPGSPAESRGSHTLCPNSRAPPAFL